MPTDKSLASSVRPVPIRPADTVHAAQPSTTHGSPLVRHWPATLHVHAYRDGQTTRLRHHHHGPLRLFKTLYPEGPTVAHAVVVHPPGGVCEGDTLNIDVEVAQGSHLLVTTPGATRFYRCEQTGTRQCTTLRVHPGARLEWLPLEGLAYPGTLATNALTLHVAEGAELLAWDVLCLGLPTAGVAFERGSFTQRWHWPGVWREQGVLAAEDTRLLHSPLGLGGHAALGTLVYACGTPLSTPQRETLLEQVRAALPWGDVRAAATSPDARLLLVRASAPLVEPLMQTLQSAWAMLRAAAWGMAAPAPRAWRL